MMINTRTSFTVGALLMCGSALTMGFQANAATATDKKVVKLAEGNWNPAVRTKLNSLMAASAFQGKKAIFDFDNTTISRDIGEATMAALVEAGKITLKGTSRLISPDFVIDGKKISLDTVESIPEYYEAFLGATKHQNDQTPYSNSYAWTVQSMAGMTPAEFLPYSEKAFGNNKGLKDSGAANLQETKINGYRVPFFYPEMVDLYGTLMDNGYEVYVASASNVWTIRMMVQQMNKKIAVRHPNVSITPDHVMGINVLLKDKRDGELYKDQILVRNNAKYANLDRKELANYELTTQIVYPITGYFGKVANILKYVTKERPFLIGGDSSNDLPMLDRAENRLWITRLESMGYQERLVKQIADSLPGNWLIQPVLYKKSPGFVSSQAKLNKRLASNSKALKKVTKTVTFLKDAGELSRF